MSAADLCVASVGHVGNSMFVKGGLEVFHDRLGRALSRQGVEVVSRAGATALGQPAIVQFFGSFYGLEDAFRACHGPKRVVFPFLLHSDESLAPWRPPLDRLRSHLPWSLLSARRHMLANADLVIASSRAEGEDARAYGARRRAVLKGGIDLEPRLPAPRSAGELEPRWRSAVGGWREAETRCLAIGRFEARKRQVAIARACGGMGLGVLFIGRRSPAEPRYLDEVAAELPPRSGICEDATDAVVRWALSKSHIHVLATRHETIGLVSLEAAAAGCRPVAIDQPTSREYLRPIGELAADSSVRSLREAMRRALDRGPVTPAERRRLHGLTWDSMASRLIELYRDLLAATA